MLSSPCIVEGAVPKTGGHTGGSEIPAQALVQVRATSIPAVRALSRCLASAIVTFSASFIVSPLLLPRADKATRALNLEKGEMSFDG